MSTAITATLIEGPDVVDVREKHIKLSLALPTSWTEAGIALDLSAYFDYVSDYKFSGVSVTDYGINLKLIGTFGTSTHAGNYSASTIKVIGIEAPAKTGDAEAATMALGICVDAEDHHLKLCHLEVWGY